MTMNPTLVINAKGGVGKSTITTNLASYFAARGIITTIADFDPQGSSLNWLAQRSSDARKIHGADPSSRHAGGWRNRRAARVPADPALGSRRQRRRGHRGEQRRADHGSRARLAVRR